MWNGRIDGFVAFHEGDDAMTGAVLGYDRRLPIKAGLYRMLFALLMVEGAKRKVLINLSAGADRFKALRGGMPVEEYDAVFDRHLLPARRLAWSTLRVATGIWWRVRRPAVTASTTRRPAGVDWDRTWRKTWKPDPGNPWHRYQAGACAAWTFGGDGVPQTHTSARVLKTDAFDEACGFDPLSTLVGAVPRFLMDISPHIASAAVRARSPICGICVTDIRTLAFHPASFDFIFSPSTIDHFADGRDISAALRELWAVLRPGGRLLITVDNPFNPLVRARNALCRVAGPVNPLIPFFMGRTLSRAGLVKVLGRTQFEVVRSGYVVHAPRVLALWLGEWTARRGNKRYATWLQAVLERLDRGLAVLPTRRWTAHYVIADCYRPLQKETAPSIVCG